jgi:hypothetical protein
MVIFSQKLAKLVNLILKKLYFSQNFPKYFVKKSTQFVENKIHRSSFSGHNALGRLVLCTFLPWVCSLGGKSIHKQSTYGCGPFGRALGVEWWKSSKFLEITMKTSNGDIQKSWQKKQWYFLKFCGFQKFDNFSPEFSKNSLTFALKKTISKYFCC